MLLGFVSQPKLSQIRSRISLSSALAAQAPGNEYTSGPDSWPNKLMQNRAPRLHHLIVRGNGGALLGVAGRHEADVGQVAVALRVVHAIADHEQIGDGEADVICLDFLNAPGGLVEERGDAQ